MAKPFPSNLSPFQKPILKKRILLEDDISPLDLSLGVRQVSLQQSFLDSTLPTSFQLPTEEQSFTRESPLAVRPRKHTVYRTFSSVTQNVSLEGRRRAISTVGKILPSEPNQSPSKILDTSLLRTPAMPSKVQSPSKKNERRLSQIRSRSNTNYSQVRSRSSTKDRSFLLDKSFRMPQGEAKEKETLDKSILKKPPVKKVSKEQAKILKVIGSDDITKKDKLAKFLDHSLRRVFKMTESKVKGKSQVSAERKALLEKLRGDHAWKMKQEKSEREIKSESLDEVKELQSDHKSEKNREMAEYVFYREINDLIQFCVKENLKHVFLSSIKLLGNMYILYEKIDEAFHCFAQLRWASEYLGEYKFKAKAFFHMAECCKMVANYDEAIKLLRKALQYSWDDKLLSQEMKIYDTLGKLYYLKGEVKKAYYYNTRFSEGMSEPIDSPLREIYYMFLKENNEKGKFGLFETLDSALMSRISLPSLPGEHMRRNSIASSLSTISFDDQRRQDLEKRPANVKPFYDQLSLMMVDTELVIQRKKKVNPDTGEPIQEGEDKQEGPTDPTDLPSPTYKTNFADFDPGRNHEQRLRELKIKEERLNGIIKNAKKDLSTMTEEGERKQRMHNIVQLQLAFQREKKLIVRHQQDYRIHIAKLWKNQYHVFDQKNKPALTKVNIKTDSHIVMENKFDMNLEDPDFFQGVKRKVMAQRFENNLPPFILMTHKKVQLKPLKRDKGLLNEGAKKIYLQFHKKIMKQIAPDKVNKLTMRDGN